jgi:adenine-specific DNA-methyltransferase
LIYAYQYLLDWYLAGYIQSPASYKKQLLKIGDTAAHGANYKLTVQERKRILLDHIYAVDTDTQAVEVTKLSLLLKALEGLSVQEIQKNLFNERVLPDLSGNIKCGNSLIGNDFWMQGTLGLTEEQQYRVNAFDWEHEFAGIFKDGGFDAVIGNPPYVRMQTIDKNQIDYFRQHYKSSGFGNYDLYVLFIELSLHLVNGKGLSGMILPHKFFKAEYGQGIRNIIADGSHVFQINDFTTNQVFESATTYTCLLFLTQQKSNNFQYQEIKLGKAISDELLSPKFNAVPYSKLKGNWNFTSSDKDALFEKISQGTITLANVSRKIFKGSSTGNDDIYLLKLISVGKKKSTVFSKVLNENIIIENELLKPFIYGEDVRKYYVEKTDIYLLFPYCFDEKMSLITIKALKIQYPLAASYFGRVKDILSQRRVKFDSTDYYKYSAARSLAEYNQAKILIPDMLVESRFGIDLIGEYYHGPAIHSFVLNEQYAYLGLKYIIALLSSRLFWFFISNTSTALRGNTYRLTPEYINPFPLKILDLTKKPDRDKHDKLVAIVDQMLALKQREQAETLPQTKTMIGRQIQALDRQIDALVYGLYGLSEDEIKVAEGE